MEIFLKQKLEISKSCTSLVFNTFSFEPRKIEKILVYREVPRILEIANRSLPSSPSLFPPPLAGAPATIRSQEGLRGHLDVCLATPHAYTCPWPLGTATRRPPCTAPPSSADTSLPSVSRPVRPPSGTL